MMCDVSESGVGWKREFVNGPDSLGRTVHGKLTQVTYMLSQDGEIEDRELFPPVRSIPTSRALFLFSRMGFKLSDATDRFRIEFCCLRYVDGPEPL